ncbi:hypothetical protein CHM34_05285 [Paludifilum halophilum]|uniref:Thioredoxin domain-containing protein n=2 Tax=Paludifilum halophilum TaxID=1642702 RepID=A0A235B8N4_9BACL|nr:hypothetical protein CHM34_05285 [Paludifilum halophilum]
MLFSLVVLTACGTDEPENNGNDSGQKEQQALNWEVPDFQYTDQDGELFGLSDLDGKVWLADTIFTRCPDVCPPMTANMSRVQKTLDQEGLDVEIVSFSVDPEHDQPKVLEKFGEKHDVDFDNWHFLTGYSDQEIQKLVRDGFKGTVQKQERKSEDDPLVINHPVSFFLVDRNGTVYQRYDGINPDVDQMMEDVKKLQQK